MSLFKRLDAWWALFPASLLAAITLLATDCVPEPGLLAPTLRSAYTPPVFGPRDSVFTDDQLLSAAYSDYQLPPGFYQESSTPVPVYYVNNGSIRDSYHRPPLPWTELSTEDVAQARAWAESSVAHGNAMARVAATAPIVNQRYFEFADEPGPGVTHVRMRIHRSSYLSDVIAFVPDPASPVGIFHVRPVEMADVHTLAEYLWTHGSQRVGVGQKVLSSFTTAGPLEVVHTLYAVQLSYGDYGTTDRITLNRLVYRIDRASGAIRLAATSIRTLHGRRN